MLDFQRLKLGPRRWKTTAAWLTRDSRIPAPAISNRATIGRRGTVKLFDCHRDALAERLERLTRGRYTDFRQPHGICDQAFKRQLGELPIERHHIDEIACLDHRPGRADRAADTFLFFRVLTFIGVRLPLAEPECSLNPARYLPSG